MNAQYPFDHYDALIFDLDGTLVDSMPLHLDAWAHTCAEFGIPFKRDQIYQYGGMPTRQIITMLAEQHGLEVDVEAFTQRKIALYMQHIDKVSVFAKMWELVRHYHGKRAMGIGTGSPRSQADAILRRTGLDAYIKVVVSADDVTHHKPHPDTFLLVAKRLGVNPAHCLVFEDSRIGLEAGKAAGMDTVLVIAGELQLR